MGNCVGNRQWKSRKKRAVNYTGTASTSDDHEAESETESTAGTPIDPCAVIINDKPRETSTTPGDSDSDDYSTEIEVSYYKLIIIRYIIKARESEFSIPRK